ncbi:MAG: DUF2066 domain-containing protein, partial [Gammaproteobacteria bacterium]|nr:DUF2066 domain-containing protein [Gammaproteobacteria bacterium]
MRVSSLFPLLIGIAAFVPWTPVFAAEEVGNLYEAEVNVLAKGQKDRKEAFGLALLQVAVKVSGSRGASANPVIVEAMESPNRFV